MGHLLSIINGVSPCGWGCGIHEFKGDFIVCSGVAVYNEQVFTSVSGENSSIQVFTLKGDFVRTWGSRGEGLGLESPCF